MESLVLTRAVCVPCVAGDGLDRVLDELMLVGHCGARKTLAGLFLFDEM